MDKIENHLAQEDPSVLVPDSQARRPILSFSLSEKGRYYVDLQIQRRMLLGLVILEVSVVTMGLVYLYFRFKSAVEENMYRIHQAPQSVFSVLLKEVGWMLLALLVVNLLALFIADRLWIGYVKKVLHTFGMLADKVADLDFRPDALPPAQHESLDLMLTWRRGEQERSKKIRAHLQSIHPDELNLADPEVRKRLHQDLIAVRRSLPPYSRRFVGRLPS